MSVIRHTLTSHESGIEGRAQGTVVVRHTGLQTVGVGIEAIGNTKSDRTQGDRRSFQHAAMGVQNFLPVEFTILSTSACKHKRTSRVVLLLLLLIQGIRNNRERSRTKESMHREDKLNADSGGQEPQLEPIRKLRCRWKVKRAKKVSSSGFQRDAFVITTSRARLRERQRALLIGATHRHTLLARLSVRDRFPCPWRCVFTSQRGTNVALATRDKELQ